MLKLNEVLKASKLGGGAPDYWTELFARRVAGGWTVSTITGVLPLTFTAKGGNVSDWVIEGNNDVGENLYDKNTYTAIRARLNSDGEIQEGTLDWQISDYIPIEANENYTISNVVGFSPAYCLYDSNKNYISGNTYANNTNIIFQAPANAAFARFSVKYGSVSGADPNIDVFMVTKGSIAPDHYIPYQQGVGERTQNLVEGKIANTNINAGGQIISNPDYNTWVAPVKQGVTYTFTTDGAVYAEYTEYPVLGSIAYNNTRVVTTTTFTATIDGYIVFRTSTNYATAMCVVGSTAPQAYIPYGYQIPITVSQQGQPDKTVNIYIGDSPLTEGETVSKTSTGQGIELFAGENTVSTTLYNKPAMEIKYK